LLSLGKPLGQRRCCHGRGKPPQDVRDGGGVHEARRRREWFVVRGDALRERSEVGGRPAHRDNALETMQRWLIGGASATPLPRFRYRGWAPIRVIARVGQATSHAPCRRRFPRC
jgi:hypothetical protein